MRNHAKDTKLNKCNSISWTLHTKQNTKNNERKLQAGEKSQGKSIYHPEETVKFSRRCKLSLIAVLITNTDCAVHWCLKRTVDA